MCRNGCIYQKAERLPFRPRYKNLVSTSTSTTSQLRQPRFSNTTRDTQRAKSAPIHQSLPVNPNLTNRPQNSHPASSNHGDSLNHHPRPIPPPPPTPHSSNPLDLPHRTLALQYTHPRHPAKRNRPRPRHAARALRPRPRARGGVGGNNFTHLHEQPTVLYATVLALVMLGVGETGGVVEVGCWVYVGLRVVHSWLQAGDGAVVGRFVVFAGSSVVLLGLSVRVAWEVFL